jgi:hypothetical protein
LRHDTSDAELRQSRTNAAQHQAHRPGAGDHESGDQYILSSADKGARRKVEQLCRRVSGKAIVHLHQCHARATI